MLDQKTRSPTWRSSRETYWLAAAYLGLGVQRQLNVGLRERVLNEAGAVVAGRAISTPDVTDARIGSLGRSPLDGRPQPVLLEEAVE